jgi:chaperonin GroES
MRLCPLRDHVLVRRAEPETKTIGGIFIPDAVQEKPLEGEIVAVGPGARGKNGELVPIAVKDGDRVLFNKWSGTAIRLEGEELLIMTQDEIMGVFDRAVAEVKAA